MKKNEDPKPLNSIEKAIEILFKFQEDQRSRGIRELSQELGFSPATVQRILKTLKKYDFVRQNAVTRQYYIGNVFYRFIQTLHKSNDLTSIARKFMEEVASKTRETVHFNIIEADHRLCIDTIESPRSLKAGMPIGHRSPLYAGASAKCLLAFTSASFIESYLEKTQLEPITGNTIADAGMLRKELEKIQKQGYALSLGERTPGLGSVSAPVLGPDGAVQASLSLAVPEMRFSNEAYLEQCIRVLIATAASFSKTVGYI